MADIGDMQSVSGDLSTFSGHLVICREMLDRVKMLSMQSKNMMGIKMKNKYESENESMRRLNSQGDGDDEEEMNRYSDYDDNADGGYDESVDRSDDDDDDDSDKGMFSSLVLLDEIGTG